MDALRAVLLTAHLLTNAVACGAPAAAVLLAMSRRWRARWSDVIHRLVLGGIVAMLIGAVLGGMSGSVILAAEDRAYLTTVARIPSLDIAMLVTEWFFTLLLYFAMAWLTRGKVRRPWLLTLVGFAAVTNLAYHFPTIMSVVATEADASPLLVDNLANDPLDRDAYRQRILKPAMIARTLHFWALSVTTAGVAVGLAARAAKESRRLTTLAAWGTLAGLALQMKTGVATLALLDAGAQRTMMGGDATSTAALAGTALIVLAAGGLLLPAARGAAARLPVGRLITLITIATLLMTLTADRSRAQKTPGQRNASTGRVLILGEKESLAGITSCRCPLSCRCRPWSAPS